MTKHDHWLEKVPSHLLPFVDAAVKSWNQSADEWNQWDALDWNELDERLTECSQINKGEIK
jgi:hypothetical protein